MKTVKQLKEERASKLEAQQNLVNVARSANKELEGEDVTRFDNLQTEIEALDAAIVRAQKIEDNEKRAAAAKGEVIDAPAVQTKKQERFSVMKALRDLASGKGLSGVEAEVHEQAIEEMRSQKLNVPDGLAISIPSSVMRAQTVSDDAGAKGGALVSSVPQIVQPLQPNLPIASLGVTIMDNLVGDVPLPTSASFTFSFTGETDAVAASDVAISGPTLKPKRCTGVVDISKKLLLQTSGSIESYIMGLINTAYGNAITSAALNGGGGDEPTGLYTLITTNINTTAGVPTHATVVDLEGLVDAADATNISRAYLSDTKLRALMKTTKIDAGSGIFLTDGKELNGYPLMASTLVPALGVGDVNHPLIFGDWSQLHVGYWGAVSIMVDPYTQAASGKVRLIVEGYSDVALTNEKAFAINKVMTLS